MNEEFRRACEAREWIKRTNGDPQRIGELLKRIAQKRGQAMADQLRADMREQWRARARYGAGTTQAE